MLGVDLFKIYCVILPITSIRNDHHIRTLRHDMRSKGNIMRDYDLCVAWNWEYDADFIALLEGGCKSKGLSMLQVTPVESRRSAACPCRAGAQLSSLLRPGV